MDLDPGMETFIADMTAQEEAAGVAVSLAIRRAQFVDRCRRHDRPLPVGIEVLDASVGTAPGIPVRIYRPTAVEPLPTVVYFHGGGWVVGDLDSHHTISAGIAEAATAVVVAVHYRRAPEHPFPAAFDDAFAVVGDLASDRMRFGIDGRRLAVAGDSAGGNLAAAVALAARERGGPALRGQALVYPALDPALALPSCQANAHGPLLTRAAMAEFWAAYLAGAPDTDNPFAAPLRARDLRRLPPAFVATAARDPLRDEGRLYAERLRDAGVPVAYREAQRLVHGYLRARFVSADAAAEFAALCQWLRATLA